MLIKNNLQVKKVLSDLLGYCRDNKYAGWSKHDGLDSPVMKFLAGNNRWLRLAAIQLIMRAPINIRPIFRVPKKKNPKGIALFAQAYLKLIEIEEDKQLKQFYIEEAQTLLNWLLTHPSPLSSSLCWGYQHPWQDLGFYQPAGSPNRVVTFFCAKALIRGYEVLGQKKYLDAADEAMEFMLNAPKTLFESSDMKCLSYVPDDEMKMAVMDVSSYAASVAAHIAYHTNNDQYRADARKLLNYVVDKQTDYGAWYYTHPPEDSFITHDNYHTGAILDAILDYMELTGDRQYQEVYYKGLNFYRDELFLNNGAPKFMHDKTYPFDIHGAAHGIITFSRAGKFDSAYIDTADKIVDWTLKNLYNPNKQTFYYQKCRFYTKRFTLMRWCNAWMAKALAEYLAIANL